MGRKQTFKYVLIGLVPSVQDSQRCCPDCCRLFSFGFALSVLVVELHRIHALSYECLIRVPGVTLSGA